MKRYKAIKYGKRVAGALGLRQFARLCARRIPRILMYHRFSKNHQNRRFNAGEFRQQLEKVARKLNIISMGDLENHLRQYGEVPANTAVITIDDGHQDFYDLAYPVIRDLDLPATLYATKRYLA